MKLKEYIDKINNLGLDVSFGCPGCESVITEDALNQEIIGLSFDSRTVCPGALFVCKGAGFKKEYLDAAIENGAAAWVSGPDIRRAMAVLSNMFYDEPWKGLNLVGITGTKGKTTTLYYLKSIMEGSAACGPEKFGFLSTIDTYDGVNFFESHLTTPEAIELGERLANMRDSGIKAACMEVSSQALKYDRTYGVRFKYGVFTNFGADHIGDSEHPDVEDYLQSKLKIFEQSDVAILGLNNEKFAEALEAAKACEKIICYKAENVRKEGGATVFDAVIHTERVAEDSDISRVLPPGPPPHPPALTLGGAAPHPGVTREIKNIRYTMPGLFNAENAAAAAAIALQLGASEEEIRFGLLDARAPGRMELFENKARGLVAITDYAHNELSYEKLLSSVKKEYPEHTLVAVFGCTGNKGQTRREELPRAAAKYVDYCFITEDDPGFEDPMEISKTVLQNLLGSGGNGEICIDRTEAVSKAIKSAKQGTVVLVLGKGRDAYQLRKGNYEPIEPDPVLVERLIKE